MTDENGSRKGGSGRRLFVVVTLPPNKRRFNEGLFDNPNPPCCYKPKSDPHDKERSM
jgi:hypothetical protein